MARNNDDNQHSFGKQVSAVLTGVVGAAAFNRLGGRKLLAEGVPKVNKFLTKLTSDISEMSFKDFNAKNINRLYKEHISDSDSTLKMLAKEGPEKIRLSTSGNNASAAIVRMLEAQADSKNMMQKIFNSEYADDVTQKLSAKYKIKNQEFQKQLHNLTREIIDKDNLISHIDDDGVVINKDLVNSFINLEEMNLLDQQQSFFSDLLDVVENKQINYNNYIAKHTNEDGSIDLIKNITNEFTGKSFAETFGASDQEDIITKLTNKITDKDRGLTFGDYVANLDKFDDQIISLADGTQVSLKEEIVDFVHKHDDIQNVLIDAKNLRIDSNNQILDFSDINEMKDNISRSFAGTLPGKIAKTTDFLSAKNPGAINFIEKDKAAHLIGKDGVADKHFVQVLNNIYEIDSKNNLKKIENSNEFFVMSSRHGSMPRMLHEMFGLHDEKIAKSKLGRKFDLGQTSESTIIEDMSRDNSIVGSIARKFTGAIQYNVMDRILNEDLAKKDPMEYRKNLIKVDHVFSQITHAPNQKTIDKLFNVAQSELGKDILEALQINNIDDMVEALSKYKDSLRNKNLKQLINTGTKDREKVAKMLSITSDRIDDNKKVLKYKDLLLREGFKEALISETINTKTGIVNKDIAFQRLRQAGITGQSYDNARKLVHWSTLQAEGNLYNSTRNEKNINVIRASNNKVLDLLLKDRKSDGSIPRNAEVNKDLQKLINQIKQNYSELTTRTDINKADQEIRKGIAHNEAIVMRKGYSTEQFAKDIIKDLNDFEKIKANAKKFSMQFIAGKNSPEYVTTYTMAPYFFTSRLTEPFKKYGLGLSSENMTSVGKQWQAIMMKRVLPVAAGITAYSYLDYETKNFTGTSITGALAQGIANVDLGLRKIGDITGIGHLLDTERKLNPITQYWFGEDYQDSRERKGYYENGYDAVRKGRWWGFGSASEFRGSKISYYQPNFVKRATSNWYDEGLYGGSDEKWKHSWIPTPRHPFAPIRRALDPYWLERKHYYDRPYMETAPLFSTGTPWGAVLNPTLGEIIKPVRKMHRNETRRGLVDPRELIAERNERLKAKALDKNKENLFAVSDTGVSNITYTPLASADPNKTVVTFTAGNGKISQVDANGIGYSETVTKAKDTIITKEGIAIEEPIENGYIGNTRRYSSVNNMLTDLESTQLGSIVSNAARTVMDSTQYIAGNNYAIMQKAATKRDGVISEKANLAKIPFKRATASTMTRQDESDLLLTTSKHDFINDALFSGKQLSGIYGFLADTVLGADRRKIRLESADKMGSFKTRFWDANIGGLGGGVMEIARRFFPHDDHSWTEINPIRNTMPDWMPERFKTGDPYRKVPKGEMRLPGQGYESIHQLRSDEYGKYGALDRMRILGDIAPWSDEYKLWRDVAKKTVTDDAGKKEMKDTKKRVEKQSRSHEFYNYKFLGNPSEINSETIKTVDGSTITTVSGKTINLAGVSLNKNADTSQYLQSGMNISVETLKKDRDKESAIAGAVYVNGQNINKTLVDTGQASGDISSVMGARALTGQSGQLYGAAMEAIAHAPIPFIHSKLMKIDTPLESYKNERVYGSPYSTWDHPIRGFIMPAFQKSWARGPVGQALAVGAWALAENVWKNTEQVTEALKFVGIDMSETTVNKLASTVFNVVNPGAFAGSMIASVPTGLMGSSEGIKGLLNTAVFQGGAKPGAGRIGARVGATVMLAGYGLTRTDKPLESTAIFSVAGMALAKQLDHEDFGGKEGALIGAGVGLVLSALRNPRFDKDKMFGIYTPESTKKRWDVDEYYDRLEYVKYKGLYEKAARKARFLEGTNIKRLVQANEYQQKVNQKKIDKIDRRISGITNSNLDKSRKEELLSRLNSERYELTHSEQVLRGGKYTKAAIAYKQALDSTIYGLQENATSQQVLRAIPKGDKDFFMEFAKEKDKKKQNEILKYVSPYQRRALQIAWGREKIDKVESNESYFKKHALPGMFWRGWTPQVDMEHVKMKTIKNEGMLLSDFGIYESQGNEPAAVVAPTVGKFDKANAGGLGLQARLQGELQGLGLSGVKVSVTPSSANGIEVFANIANSLKTTEYKIRDGINQVMGTRMFY